MRDAAIQAFAVARPLKATLCSARRLVDRSEGCLLYRWETKHPGIRHDDHRVGLSFRQMLDDNAYHYWGREAITEHSLARARQLRYILRPYVRPRRSFAVVLRKER